MTSRQPADLDRYLARHRFRPHPGDSTWLEHDTGQYVIRVVREHGERTELICLTRRGACLYQAAFSPDTPDAVIIAAVHAALSPAQIGPALTPKATEPSGVRANEGVTCDDDR